MGVKIEVVCSKCSNLIPGRTMKKWTGRPFTCFNCKRKKAKEYYLANRESILAHKRKDGKLSTENSLHKI